MTVRLIRPIRLTFVFPKLKHILDSLLGTLPELSKNFLSLIVIMIFYAIIGLHLFMGGLDYRCRIDPTSIEIMEGTPFLCGNIECPE